MIGKVLTLSIFGLLKKKGESRAHKFSNTDWYPSLLDSGTTHSTRAHEAQVLSAIFKSQIPCHHAMVE